MKTTTKEPARLSPRAYYTIGGGAALLVIVAAFYYFRVPPQMGADPEVFREVDALYTAVTAKDEKLLGQCEARLKALGTAGKMPADAAGYLDSVIATARQGRWRPAAERLYDFMSVQRRERPR